MSDSSQYFMSSSNDKIAYRCNGLESDTTIFFFWWICLFYDRHQSN